MTKRNLHVAIRELGAGAMAAALTVIVGCGPSAEKDAANAPAAGGGVRVDHANSSAGQPVPAPIKEPYEPPVNERELIDWVWQQQGSVEFQPLRGNLGGVSNPREIPTEPFSIVRIHLNKKCQGVRDADFARLQGLTSLQSLILDDAPITDAALVHLRGLSSLRSLVLNRTNVTDAALVHVGRLANLTDLWLNGTNITDGGLEHLSGLSRLKTLSLEYTQIDGSGFRHLRDLKSLDELRLRGSHVTDEGLSHLAVLTSLRRLDLAHTAVNGSGLKYLPGSLRSLAVGRLGDRDLASISALPHIRVLQLGTTNLSDEAMKVLLQAHELEELSLGPSIGDRSVVYLSELHSLTRLHMEVTRISQGGKEELDKALPKPKCTVYWAPPR